MRLIALAFGVLLLTACSEPPQERMVVVQPAKVITVGEEFLDYRELPGTVRAAQRSELSFQVPGQIVQMDVKEGQEVQAGDLLGKLDESDYRSEVTAAQAELEKNRSNFERAEELITGNFISKSDYDQIKAAFEVAEANLERAQKALRDTSLVAPFTGVVAKTYAENFEDVQAKQAILSLQGTDDLEIVVAISETLIARRSDSDNVDVNARFDAVPDTAYPLYIKEFATEADPQTQTFEYVLGMEGGSPGNILPGMTATVVIAEQPEENSLQPLAVPMSAIFAGEDDQHSVWVVDADNTVTRRGIQTGSLAGSDRIEVTAGLSRGDVIVIAGVNMLSEGKAIKPIGKVSY